MDGWVGVGEWVEWERAVIKFLRSCGGDLHPSQRVHFHSSLSKTDPSLHKSI